MLRAAFNFQRAPGQALRGSQFFPFSASIVRYLPPVTVERSAPCPAKASSPIFNFLEIP